MTGYLFHRGDVPPFRPLFGRRVALAFMLAGAVFLSGCAAQPRVLPPRNAAGDVADLSAVPQNLAVFAQAAGGNVSLRSDVAAAEDMERFRQRFFAPWAAGPASKATLREFKNVLDRSPGRRGYAENMRPWSSAAWEGMRANAALDSVPGEVRPAIVTQHADLRLVPTLRPGFARIRGAGQGWPFDDFQQSSLAVGVPVMVHHASRDGAWLLVQSPMAWGWVEASRVAFVDEAFKTLWREAPLACFVKEGVPLSDGGAFVAMADIGTVLPMQSGGVLVPVRSRRGLAESVAAAPATGTFVAMPEKLTADAVASVGDRMMGAAYGWGGMYGNRDCSAMMRDLFAPFGIWLPRNSAAQAKAGDFHEIRSLDAQAKKQAILRGAEPFRTLLWLPGHIGLYVGEYRGEPVFFHDIWGIRNTLPDGSEGRVILGRAVITTTQPGRERADMSPEALLLQRMRGYTVIGGH